MCLAQLSERRSHRDNSERAPLNRTLPVSQGMERAVRRSGTIRLLTALIATFLLSAPAVAQIKLPVKPKPSIRLWCVLTAMSLTAAAADIHYSLASRRTGGFETDPIVKPFDALPAPAYRALGLSAVAALDLGCLKLKQSPHVWVRRFWWVPEVIQIWGNSRGAKVSATE